MNQRINIHSYDIENLGKQNSDKLEGIDEKITHIANNLNNIFDDMDQQVNLHTENIDKLNIFSVDLLEKIDYLFEMLYHSDSKTIMENYPILK